MLHKTGISCIWLPIREICCSLIRLQVKWSGSFKYSINPSANATTIMSEGEYIWVSSIVGGVTRLHILRENLIIISIMRMPGCLLYHIQMRMGWLHWIMILTLQ